jgi:hypothetical protein
MNILKTSALAAVLALGSLSANASYTGDDAFNLVINTSETISVTFRDATMTFDNVIPGDSLVGSIDVEILGDSANSMECTINNNEISSTQDATIALSYDTNDDGTADTLAATLVFSLSDCASLSDGDQTLSVDGEVGASIDAGESVTQAITLEVTYGGVSDIDAVNS